MGSARGDGRAIGNRHGAQHGAPREFNPMARRERRGPNSERPSYMTSSLVQRMMNRGIAKMNAFAVRQLELAPTDRVLEIGFGGWQLASSESGHP